jgi:hypothetical protein
MKYLLVCRSCKNCGADVAVRQYDELPTDDERIALEKTIGGMWCITTKLFCTEDGYEYTELED